MRMSVNPQTCAAPSPCCKYVLLLREQGLRALAGCSQVVIATYSRQVEPSHPYSICVSKPVQSAQQPALQLKGHWQEQHSSAAVQQPLARCSNQVQQATRAATSTDSADSADSSANSSEAAPALIFQHCRAAWRQSCRRAHSLLAEGAGVSMVQSLAGVQSRWATGVEPTHHA